MSIVLINGSPSEQSRGAALLNRIAAVLSRWDLEISRIDIKDLPGSSLLSANNSDPLIQDALLKIRKARAIVITTPVYKASYSGLLKVFLDLLPRDAFSGKTVLPLATGGSAAHALVIDYALRPVLASLHPYRVVQGVFTADGQFLPGDGDQHDMDTSVAERLDTALVDLLADLEPLQLPAGHRAHPAPLAARTLV